MLRWTVCIAMVALACSSAAAAGLRFEVTVAPGLLPRPTDGRLLVVVAPGRSREPRYSLGDTDPNPPTQLGADVNGFAPGIVGVCDETSEIFPIASLAKLPAGEYSVQAAFDWSADLRLPNAPGNLYSVAKRVTLDPAKGGTVHLELTKQMPPDAPPKDTDRVRYLRFPSKQLSAFHKRPYVLRAGVVLPEGFGSEPDRKYPLVVFIGGYGTRYTMAGHFRPPLPVVTLVLDGAGPYGDPYQVNSANNGPYGDAITQELIPHVEAAYRCVGTPQARFTTGTSTGGWVSLALQVFYPDFFNGCWSFAPDPVDFRNYELIDIFTDENAYTTKDGQERPAMRNRSGKVIYNVRHECQIENVLGRGNRWWLSGKDWCAWNATFGPRGDDGLPKPLWDGKSGKIDRSVVEFWKQRDIRHVLETNWTALAPKLKGKIHIYVGDMDNYFLNEAVRRLDAATKTFNPPFDGTIQFGPGAGHSYHPINEWQAIAERYEATKPPK